MRVYGEFRFLGVEARPGFTDANKLNYLIGLSQGLDTLRLYIEANEYQKIMMMIQEGKLVPYSECDAELEYNPAASKVQYCMRLRDINPKGGK